MTRQKKRNLFLGGVFGLVLAALGLALMPAIWQTGAVDLSALAVDFEEPSDDSDQYVYLSDMDWLPFSRAGYGKLLKNQDANGGKIALRYDGNVEKFEKGLWAHATSNVYYDLQALGVEDAYDSLMAYVGINNSSHAGNGVIFWVYGSNNPDVAKGSALTGAENWDVLYNSENKVSSPGANADFIEVDIRGYRFLRLQVSDNGTNGNDHSVWADLKLAKANYNPYVVPDLAEIDADLKTVGDLDVANNVEHELLVLRRNFMKNAGQFALTNFIRSGAENRETLNWLYNDVDTLRMYTTGGQPSGSYQASLEVLSRLYHTYREDLEDKTQLRTQPGHTRGEMYKKMMVTLALTHAQEVRFWIRDQGEMANNPASPNISDPAKRYAVFKRMYLENKLADAVFESLEVEEMRYVMFTEMGDDELEWTNDYVTKRYGNAYYPWPPVPYISIGNHYWFDSNYAPENQAKWISKYSLVGDNYSIGFEPKAPHLWMIMEHGGVCWQISNTGQNLVAARGIPSTTFGQPGHLAFSNYELGTGIPAWALTNDVSGWQQTNFTGYTNTHTYHQVRQLNNWGAIDGSYALLNGKRYGSQGSYVVMAQAALNNFSDYEKSQILVATADVYDDDLVRQERLYEQALAVQNINFDAWYGLLENYAAQGKTVAEYHQLASRVVTALERYPVPMYDLMQYIIAQIPMDDSATVAHNLATEMLLTDGLEWAAKTPAEQVNTNYYRQANVTRVMGNYLLGRLNNQVATFSFDGDDETAGYIKLGNKYLASSAAFDYSLDGGNTWSSGAYGDHWVTDKKVKLTEAEIAQINVDDDIKVHIQGVDYAEQNIYTIDITQANLPNNLYANDKENRVVGVNTTMEWREIGATGAGEWVPYRVSSPQRVGEVTIQVRVGANGTQLPSEPSGEFHFATDVDNEQRTYIPVSHLSVANVSSQATGGGQYGNAIYAIDGNIHTRWHSAWNGSDTNKWIVIKFDHTVDLSALEYVPAGGGNGRIMQADIYVSADTELNRDSFKLAGQVATNCGESTVICQAAWPNVDNTNVRTFEFARTNEEGETIYEPVRANYVAMHVKQSSSAGGGSFVAARMLNFYEDRTHKDAPTASVAYSTMEATNGEVMARLVNASREIEITSTSNTAEKDTYIFSENGEFTFVFQDKEGNVGQAIAKVDWIDKEAPTGRIEYYCAEEVASGEKCDGTKKVNRSVTARLVITNEREEVIVLNNGTLMAEDDANTEEVSDAEKAVNRAIEALTADTNDDNKNPFTYVFLRNGEFVFQVQDKAGNVGEITARVDWIDKDAPEAVIEYSTLEETTDEVVARLVKLNEDGEDFVVLNNEGAYEYKFRENGQFTFEYADEAGNVAATTAKVDWIQEKEDPKPDNPDIPDNPKPDTPDKPTPEEPNTPDKSEDDNPAELPSVLPGGNEEEDNRGSNQVAQGGTGSAGAGNQNYGASNAAKPIETPEEVTDKSEKEQEKKSTTSVDKNNAAEDKKETEVEKAAEDTPWYQSPIVVWGGIGVVVVLAAGWGILKIGKHNEA